MTGIVLALLLLVLVALLFRPLSSFFRHRKRRISQARLAAIYPPTLTEASRTLHRVYAETPHGHLFDRIAANRVHALPVPTTQLTPSTVACSALTRGAVDILHVFFADEIRRGSRIPPLFLLPSPVFDGFSQPVTGDDGKPHTVAVLNPLLFMTLPSYLAMYFVLIDRDCSDDFRVDTMARFMSLTRTLVLADGEGVQKALNDFAFYHCLHVDPPVAQAAVEEYGYRPSPHVKHALRFAYRYIVDFLAMHECAHHFLGHTADDFSTEDLPFLAEPRILTYRPPSREEEADRIAAQHMLGYRSTWGERHLVDTPTFHFAIQFYLALLDYITFVGRQLEGCSFTGVLSPPERYLQLKPVITGAGGLVLGDTERTEFIDGARSRIKPVFRAHQEGLRAALARTRRPVLQIAS